MYAKVPISGSTGSRLRNTFKISKTPKALVPLMKNTITIPDIDNALMIVQDPSSSKTPEQKRNIYLMILNRLLKLVETTSDKNSLQNLSQLIIHLFKYFNTNHININVNIIPDNIKVKFFDDLNVIIFFIENGTDPNIINKYGDTPLHLAAKGHLEIVRVLLEKGADVNKADEDGQTPLHLAAANGRLEIIRLLLDRGADINLAYIDGTTPLLIATQEGHLEIVRLLLDRGADINAVTKDGQTPLFIAADRNYLEIVRLLLLNGAFINVPIMKKYISKLCLSSKPGDAKILTLLLQDPGGDPYTGTIDRTGCNSTILSIIDTYYINNRKKWKGFSSVTIDFLDKVFDNTTQLSDEHADPRRRTPQHKISICPICNSYAEHTSACNHMQHNCSKIQPFINNELYKKYKSSNGNIHWCTVCGRICNPNGNHYEVVSYDSVISSEYTPKVSPLPVLQPTRNELGEIVPKEDRSITSFLYTWDCRYAQPNSGGGIPEKILRLHILRESIKRIQDEDGLDKISAQDGWNRITKAIWDAVTAPSIELKEAVTRELAAGRFELPSTDFRDIPDTDTEINTSDDLTSYKYPTVPWTDATTAECQPVLYQNQEDPITLDIVPNIVQFKHRQQNGTVKIHSLGDECYSIQRIFIGENNGTNLSKNISDGLLSLKSRNKLWLTIKNFGACIICNRKYSYDKCTTCTGLLYPQELQIVLDKCVGLTPEQKAIYQAILDEYILKFNKKFASAEHREKGAKIEKTNFLKEKRRAALTSTSSSTSSASSSAAAGTGMRKRMIGGGMFVDATKFTTTACNQNTCVGNTCALPPTKQQGRKNRIKSRKRSIRNRKRTRRVRR